MKVNLIIEPEKGDPFEQEIEVGDGDRLIFRVGAPAGPQEIEMMAERIQEFLAGEAKFLVIPEEVSIIRVRAVPTPPAGG